MMKIAIAQPPNIHDINAVFRHRGKTIYCYGDTIYNPDNFILQKEMIAHEEVHMLQQEAMTPEVWWNKYLTDISFRASQELPAFKRQFQVIDIKDRNARVRYANRLAEIMSGEAYGHCMTFEDALSFITS